MARIFNKKASPLLSDDGCNAFQGKEWDLGYGFFDHLLNWMLHPLILR